jgi:SP family arabinose:H+ symporter-like MFS transporter
MKTNKNLVSMIALIVALGGLLMGFDASVISGVVKFIEPEFGLNKLELGWSVASLTLTATLAMMIAGPISDKYGRRTVLRYAAALYAVSAILSAFAPSFLFLVIARMIGGFGVGASLILAPMYIAEIAPKELRGRLVSFNQLNIVIGISLAFFTNYLILQLGKSDASWAINLKFTEYNWRWMLGLETLPAIFYFVGLFFVPPSPRWLIMRGRFEEAEKIMAKVAGPEAAKLEIDRIQQSIAQEENKEEAKLKDLFKPGLRLVLTIGIVVAVLQQITGINSVFFYAPMIFEQSGLGTDASFMQAILVGLVNLAFTIVAILFIDRLGRKPLLSFGVAGIALSMFALSYAFKTAEFSVSPALIENFSEKFDSSTLLSLESKVFTSENDFTTALATKVEAATLEEHQADIVKGSINMNTSLTLFSILAFVASFAISIGPVMWVLFSEIFPNKIRGIAISFVGLINSAISFLVQWIFPWELDVLGNSLTFLIYGLFAAFGLIFIIRVIPETKGKSLEEIEKQLVTKD